LDHTLVAWKILEDLLIALRKKSVQIPASVIEDLQAARSIIELSYSKDASKEIVVKTEVYITNVESYLINQAQKVFEPSVVNEWLNRLKEANFQKVTEEAGDVFESNFVIGVPRGQQWIRIETDNKLPEEYVFKLAKEWHCTVNKQTDGRLMVYGQQSNVKAFIKQVAAKIA
jgi:hypothetical protein